MAHAHVVERIDGKLVSYSAGVQTQEAAETQIARLREFDPTFEADTGTVYSVESCNAKPERVSDVLGKRWGYCSAAGFIF